MIRKSNKKDRFITEYLRDQNATKAAIRAGYAEGSARSQGCKLLKLPEVKNEIEHRLRTLSDEVMEEKRIDANWIMCSLKENYIRAMQQEPVYDKKGDPTGEYVYNGSVANKALELMGKEIGMFKDSTTININTINVLLGKIIGIIQEQVTDPDIIEAIKYEVQKLGE